MAGRGALSAGRMMPGFSRSSWLLYVRCLRTFRSLDNFELYRIPFLQSPVAIPYDSGIMNKNVGSIVAPDESVPFRIIKPFHSSLHLSSPPDGDLDVSRGELNRDKRSRHTNKLRGVYQKEALSQESFRLLRFQKRTKCEQKTFRHEGILFPLLGRLQESRNSKQTQGLKLLFHIVNHL